MFISIYIYIKSLTNINICMYTHTCTYIYKHNINTYINIYTNIYTYIEKGIYTYMLHV